MLRNNTRIIAFNPRFSNLVTRECLEKLAGTRKWSSDQKQQQQRGKGGSTRAATPIVQPLEDDFTRRLGKTRNATRVGRGGPHPQQKASESSSSYKLGHQPQFEYRRALRKRSQSLREHRSRQLLSVLHEEEIAPRPKSPTALSSSIDQPRQAPVEDSVHNTLMRTRNAKATGSSFCRFGNQNRSTDSSGHKRQLWKTRPKGFRSRVIATLVILKDHYQQILSSLNGEEVRREYSNLGGMAVNSKYDLQFVEDLDVTHHNRAFEHELHGLTEYRGVKVRFKRSLSCKI